jgi:hypothetical protein
VPETALGFRWPGVHVIAIERDYHIPPVSTLLVDSEQAAYTRRAICGSWM